MTTFNIMNTVSGDDLGRYFAEKAMDALNAMARNAGFDDYTQACESIPAIKTEIAIMEI